MHTKAVAARRGWRISHQGVVSAALGLTIFSGFVAFIEPSPYDFGMLVVMPLWFIGGFRIARAHLVLFGLVFVYAIGGFLSLIPYWNERDPVGYMLTSTYVFATAVFFALFFAERTHARAAIVLNAYAASCVIAALCGIAGYFDIFGLAGLFTFESRGTGAFKDPNVFGSYLIPGALFLAQGLLRGDQRRPLLAASALLLILTGVLVSFSRGSWLSLLLSMLLMTGLAYAGGQTAAMRARILLVAFLGAAICVAGFLILLSIGDVGAFFSERAIIVQYYDGGVTGRFGNQARAIPLLLDSPNGFGPLRFRLIFGLEPHSSFINAFASYGWVGGVAFLLIVGLTVRIGIGLMTHVSPYRLTAQVIAPTTFVYLAQGLQIDIEHWRHFLLFLGALWGLEAARLRDAYAAPSRTRELVMSVSSRT